MRSFILKNRKWIGYTLYCVLLILALLYYRFPSDAVRDYIQATVHRMNPNLLITFERMSLSFPLGLKFAQAELHVQRTPEEAVFKTKEVIIRPKIWSLISRKPEYCFICTAYDGNITGCINSQKDDRGTLYRYSFTLNDIHIDDNSPLPSDIKGRLEGVLKGSITYSGRYINDPGGTGEASINLSNGSFKLAEPVLDIKAIDFKEVLIKMTLKDQKLNISNAELKGDSILGQASGSINIKDPIQNSRLNIKGTIEPTATIIQKSTNAKDAALFLKQLMKNGKISFTIKGTIDKPSFRLI
jgi:type II secretion system protein N